jgi:hypothetical protein
MRFRWSRRAVLRGGAMVGAVTAIPPAVLAQARVARYVNLAPGEAATLEAVVARLVPSDANGPGALEAGVVTYIDGALGSALAAHRPTYAAGLAALDSYARATAGAVFAELAPQRQDAVLADLEQNRAPGFTPSAAAFFDVVLGHTLEGMFGDPHYGGNRDFIGWELIGYPGLRLAVTEEQQRMNAAPDPIFTSAYDHAQFTAHDTAGERDGD